MPMPRTEADDYFVYRLLTSALLFGLLIEWLLPWTSAGSGAMLHKPAVLFTVIGVILAVGALRLPTVAAFFINSVICLLSLTLLFSTDEHNVLEGAVQLYFALAEQVKSIAEGNLWLQNGELRTLLLFVGWAMLAPALQALLWLRQVAVILAGLTILYLLTLHVWLGMDVMSALMRTVAEGLALSAIVAVPRIQRIMGSAVSKVSSRYGSWFAGALFALMVVVGCGMLFSGGRESTMPPASWSIRLNDTLHEAIKTAGNKSTSSETVMYANVGQSAGKAISGYGIDDNEMGAPLAQDHTRLFIGTSPVKAYWRGETKSQYDGRGWSNEENIPVLRSVNSKSEKKKQAAGNAGTSLAYASGAGDLEAAASLQMVSEELLAANDLEDMNDIWFEDFSARTIEQSVSWDKPAAGLPLFSSGLSGKVTELIAADPRRKLGSYAVYSDSEALFMPSDKVKAAAYTIESQLPLTEQELLRYLRQQERQEHAWNAIESGQSWSVNSEAGLSEQELERYLQLPSALPGRVTALAAEVAGGGVTSRYDQVKAIEDYLQDSYSYTIEESKVPLSGSDFVDDFLFEQQMGYCVHFSTAMVVMLRTQGIPARWVKGFTAGDEIGEAVGLKQNYEVRASDAHAWVEVYFPGAGWVSFDPTPGFSGVVEDVAAAAFASGDFDAAAAVDAGGGTASREAAAILAQLQAAAASPAAVSAAGAAALAAALAAAAVAQRQRLRLALALRRYGAAYAGVAKLAGGSAEARPALGGVPEAPAPLAPRPRSGRERAQALAAQSANARLRASMASAAAAMSPLVNKRFGGELSPKLTAREYAAAVRAGLAPEQQQALHRLTCWLEEAMFSVPGTWTGAPTPAELSAAVRILCKRPAAKVTSKLRSN